MCQNPSYTKPYKKNVLFETLIRGVETLIKPFALYKKGYKTASTPVLKCLALRFKTLPPEFDGYRILHLTDLHIDFMPHLTDRICSLLEAVETDVCVMTGDYRLKSFSADYRQTLDPMKRILSAIRHRDGVFGVLGNHDTFRMVRPYEDLGLRFLINETSRIRRADRVLAITGVDDPMSFYTPKALRALNGAGRTPLAEDSFRVALVHTPELYDRAAENGFDLYLSGHTHGGQICLPGGIPLVLHLDKGRQFYKGVWRYQQMTGYTGQGIGTVSVPVRFNTQSEITLLTLNRVPDN